MEGSADISECTLPDHRAISDGNAVPLMVAITLAVTVVLGLFVLVHP